MTLEQQQEIAAVWSEGKLVQGPVIRHRQMRATTPEEEAELGYKVEAHERVEIDLGSTEDRKHTLDVAVDQVLFKPKV